MAQISSVEVTGLQDNVKDYTAVPNSQPMNLSTFLTKHIFQRYLGFSHFIMYIRVFRCNTLAVL